MAQPPSMIKYLEKTNNMKKTISLLSVLLFVALSVIGLPSCKRNYDSIDYSAVGLVPEFIAPNQNIYDETEQRGGTLITLKKGGETEVSQIPFTRNLYRETVEERGVKE